MPPTLLPGLAAALLLVAPPPAAGAADPLWPDPADPALAPAVAAGRAAADRLIRTLTGELAAALPRGGPAEAVAFCQLRAPVLTAGIAAEPGSGVLAVKRTSLKLRNPANAPDPAEAAALERIRSLLARGEPPPELLLQRVTRPGAPAELRVYRPLRVAQACLACHGDPATFPADLRATLAARYPADAATGYTLDAWRGLLRVSLPDPTSR